jgi:hypothetical protein
MTRGIIELRQSTSRPTTPIVRPVERFLIELEARSADADLALLLGEVIVGYLAVRGGEVKHAELPGAEGDTALSMLPQLAGLQARVDATTDSRTTVSTSWRSYYPEHDPRLRMPKLAAVADIAPDFDALFRQATQAYVRRDRARAQDLFEQCQALRPGDARVLHNLERLRRS